MKEQQGLEKDHGNIDLLSHRLSNEGLGIWLIKNWLKILTTGSSY